MKVFVTNVNGDRIFSMELDPSITVLEMKQMIETSSNVLVSKQNLFFKGKIFLPTHDNHTLQQCKVVHGYTIQLNVPSNPRYSYINQVRHQTKQASVPSNSTRGIFNSQDSSVMVGSRSKNQVLPRTDQSQVPSSSIKDPVNIENWTEKTISDQDWAETVRNINEDQMFHQSDQHFSSVPSSSTGGIFNEEDLKNIQSWPSVTTNVQDTSHVSSKNQVFPARFGISNQVSQTEQRFNYQEIPARFGISEKDLVQAEKSQPKEVINVPDRAVRSRNNRPGKLRVMILPNDSERKFPVDVNESDKVSVLRRELVKIPDINLPKEYFFIHNGTPLYEEDKSFRENNVADGDTIDVWPPSISGRR